MAKKKTLVVKKAAKPEKRGTKVVKRNRDNPSKFIGCGIFKYYDKLIQVDLVACPKFKQEDTETQDQFEKRAVQGCYDELKQMRRNFKEKARELGFKIR